MEIMRNPHVLGNLLLWPEVLERELVKVEPLLVFKILGRVW